MTVNVAYFSASVILSARLGEEGGGGATFAAGAVFLLLLIVLGEVLPKGIAARLPRATLGVVAEADHFFMTGLGEIARAVGDWL